MSDGKLSKTPFAGNSFATDMLIHSMKERGMVQIYCDHCDELLKDKEEWYHCTEKSDYDLCQKCKKELGKEVKDEMFLNNYEQLRAPSQLGTLSSVSEMLREAFRVYKNRLCMGHRRLIINGTEDAFEFEDKFTWFNYGYVYDQAVQLGSGLMKKFGLVKGDFVGLCGSNSIRWVICDIACIIRGFIVVPMDTRLTIEETSSIMNNAKVKIVLVDGNPLQSKFEELFHSKSCPDMCGIVQVNTVPFLKGEERVLKSKSEELIFYSEFEELIELGRKKPIKLNKLSEFEKKDIVTLVYTSGSTGKPKGAIFDNEVWMKGFNYYGTTRYDPYVQFSKHPLSYISDRENVLETFKFGGRVGMCSDINNIFKDVILLNPCKFGGTPRFYNVIYTEFRASIEEEERKKAGELGRKLRPAERQRIRNENLDRFSKTLGTRIQGISIGGAAVSTVVWKFMKEMWGSIVSEGYGTTEAGSICYGTQVDPNTIYKLVDVPEMGYFTSDKPHPRGELLVKTPTMIKGYYNNEEETKNGFEEGFFRTGDIVAETSHRNLEIIDRKKNIFKLSQGEFISPEKLENKFVGNEFVHQIFISCANLNRFADQNSPMAVVVPEEVPLRKWWDQSNLPPSSFENICSSNEAKRKIWEELRATGIQSKLKNFEIPSFVHLEPQQFSIENRKMTVSNKLARPILQRIYEETFENHLKSGNTYQISVNETLGGSHSQALDLIKKAMGGKNELGVGDGNTFLQSGGDSLSAVRLRNLIKRETDVEVPVEMIYDPGFSVEKLDQIIQKKSVPTISSTPAFTFEEYALMSEEIRPKWDDVEGDATAIFLTGSTGFLGQFILHELLMRSKGNVPIFCLVRCENLENGKQRLKDQMIRSGIWNQHEGIFESVIRIVPGDLSKDRLGIEPNIWSELSISINSVIHCGAYVNHTQPYSMHRDANVIGTKWIIQLASEGRKKILNFVSSIGVVSSLSRSIYRPTFVKGISGYAQSKWAAEKLVHVARERGIPTNIFRPGMISWHTELGTANLLDWFCRLIVGSIALGLIPNAPKWTTKGVSLVPVDYVSSAIAATALSNAFNETMDLMSESLTSWTDIGKKWMPAISKQKSEADEDLVWNELKETISNFDLEVSSEAWMNYIHSEIDSAQREGKIKRYEALTGLLLFPNGQLPTDSAHEDTLDSSTSILESMGIVCPNIKGDHVEPFLRFIARSDQLKEVLHS
eukprot:TRINITY_DN4128_c0_g4_i1.p1 TRINITY_DN4128_c0_g4~~TRINITY_DN4128_c0_g4_i1.p1  ORF type:complete len:1215 (+),score=400.50 TRINITY_DN4128_c0_g4_i1:165-3809(+)